jgi:hypothetical protein
MINKQDEEAIKESLAQDGEEDTFLPKGESIPESSSNYMRLSEPENRFRVLASAITGYELWVEGKPQRRKKADEFTADELQKADINKFNGKKRVPTYFWAFPVFNYKTQKIEILEITQVTIMRGIEDYLKDSDYGDPKRYDLIVVRDDSKEILEYRVKAKPPIALNKEIVRVFEDTPINLNALYDGKDPFLEG